jgi:D-alanyl-lipoteichoic acid acyltransferase DltB (MBOAT superfamily)
MSKDEEVVLGSMNTKSLGRTLVVAAELGLFLLVIERRFQVESPAFVHLVRLALAGFLVHSFLPARFRLSFFFLLSLIAIVMVFGPGDGLWVIGVGLALVGVCHLPVRPAARAVLLVAAGAGLALLRADPESAPFSPAVWPVLGAMFMFRLIVYLYDVRHQKKEAPLAQRLSYFFLLPNVCFPLFPVVDYQTFVRTYYDREAHSIHQKGIQWMFRGLVHLVLYRLVYYYFMIPSDEIVNAGRLARFLVANYLLYLRISGQFHIIIGMLSLFGFDLPRTNNLYLFASSFSDYWRRINIYWKDFMIKVFYFPAHFRLRGLPATPRLLAATAYVFAVTWLLHSYQWFWIRGSFPVTGPDIAFWGALGLLVAWNSLREAKHGRARALGRRAWTLRESFALSLRVAGVFIAICILWSLWTSATLSAWLSIWPFGEPDALGGIGWVLGIGAAAIVAGALARYAAGRGWGLGLSGDALSFRRSALVTGAALALIVVVGHRSVYAHFGSATADVIYSLRKPHLSRGDVALLQRGYYENLLGADRMGGQLWEVYQQEPADWEGDPAAMYTVRDDFLERELKPEAEFTAKRLPVRLNSLGMRDREYAREKPADTYRIAILGTSYVVGLGVAEDRTFEALVEERLNRERTPSTGLRYEILNLGVGGYRTAQRLMAMEEKAFPLDPDAIIFTVHETDPQSLKDLSDAARKGIPIPYAPLADMVEKAGVKKGTPEAVAERRLKPVGMEVNGWIYREAVRACRERGIVPYWFFLPTTLKEQGWGEDHERMRALAEEAGFEILDLADLYAGRDSRAYRLGDWDHHLNAEGHELVADLLYRAIAEAGGPVVAGPGKQARAETGNRAPEAP